MLTVFVEPSATVNSLEYLLLKFVIPITPFQKAPLFAEAVVLRSFFYYILTINFGDVPFYTTPVETAEDQDRVARLPRMSAVDTRAYLVNELLELLPKDGVVQKRTYDNPESSDYRMGAAFGWMVCAKLAMWNACQDKMSSQDWYAKAMTAKI